MKVFPVVLAKDAMQIKPGLLYDARQGKLIGSTINIEYKFEYKSESAETIKQEMSEVNVFLPHLQQKLIETKMVSSGVMQSATAIVLAVLKSRGYVPTVKGKDIKILSQSSERVTIV